MEYDITAFIEVRNGSKWYLFKEVLINKNYDLFYLMSGTKGKMDFVPISLPKGLPKDMSEALYEVWMESSYSFNESYLDQIELFKVLDIYNKYLHEMEILPKNKNFDFCEWLRYEDLKNGFNWFPDWAEEYRMVFWYD